MCWPEPKLSRSLLQEAGATVSVGQWGKVNGPRRRQQALLMRLFYYHPQLTSGP